MYSKLKKGSFLSLVILLLMLPFLFGTLGCDNKTIEEEAIEEQIDLMKLARSAVPTPKINHFLTRKTVAKWMKRMDQPQKEFYNYLMTVNGQIVYYFISQERPVPTSSFLTPAKKWWENPRINSADGDLLGPAPALDGVYYGNGPKSLFAFNAATDGYFEVVDLGGPLLIVTDQPLDIEAPELKVQMVQEEE